MEIRWTCFIRFIDFTGVYGDRAGGDHEGGVRGGDFAGASHSGGFDEHYLSWYGLATKADPENGIC